jgi:anti-repressor protein
MESLIPNQKGMTSLEIAEVTGKQHAHVMRDIRSLLNQGVHESNFGLMYRINKLGNGAERKDPYYELTPKGCLILASGYDAVLREKIIDRLEYLENEKKAIRTPQTYLEALEALVASEKEKERLSLENEKKQKYIEKLQPKAFFADCIMQSEDCISIGEMANILKQNGLFGKGQNSFFEWLRWSGYLLNRGSRYNLPSQRSMRLGIMRIAEQQRGSVFINRKAVITPYGQRYFIELFGKSSTAGQCTINFIYK